MDTTQTSDVFQTPVRQGNSRLLSLPPIRDVIVRGLRAQATHNEIKQLVNLFHKAAIAYLRPKAAMYQRMMDGMTLEEVALDAIADLFEQRSGTGFPKLASWLNRNISIEMMSDDALWVEFRRIVLGAVNQHLYRLFRYADPSLSKILRNLKLALKAHPHLQLQEINRIAAIALRNADDARRSLPKSSPSFLRRSSRRILLPGNPSKRCLRPSRRSFRTKPNIVMR